MSFRSFANDHAKAIPLMEEIGLRNAISVVQQENSMYFGLNPFVVSEKTNRLLVGIQYQTSNLLEMFILGKIFANGPKIFEVDQIDFAMMAETDLNIGIEDYAQPFETVVVQLPTQYCRTRAAMLPQAGEVHYGAKWPESHEPDFVILHHDAAAKLIAIAVVFSTGISLKSTIFDAGSQTIEEGLTLNNRMFKDSLTCSDEELAVSRDVARGAMNYAMLVMDQGLRRIGNSNERRLQGYLEKAKRRGDPAKKLAMAEAELRRLPIAYTIDRKVRLYQTVASRSDLPEPTGRRVSPHHRRGYYKMQPYGPQSSLRKRIRIAPVFVNEDLFFGKMSETTTTYA